MFLSYSHGDRDAVRAFRSLLNDGGISTFLDEEIPPGGDWLKILDHEIAASAAVIVFIGRDGLGGWHEREAFYALDQYVNLNKQNIPFSLVPVLLPGADPMLIPGFFRLNNWIDLRTTEPAITHVEAIRGVLAGAGLPASPVSDISPFRGLLRFEPQHAGFFYGRQTVVDDLDAKVRTGRFVGVVGASGSGKSSVVLAGLIPLLRARRPLQDTTWVDVVSNPGINPWRRMADAFALVTDRADVSTLASDLQAGNGALESAVERARASNGASRVLLVIDQFEELFTLTDPKFRQPFLQELIAITRLPFVCVLITLRADFYGQALQIPGMLDLLKEGQVNVGPMNDKELRDVIEMPARRVGLRYEDGLMDLILKDIAGQTDALPLLEYALQSLWQRRQNSMLTVKAYTEIGGVGEAIAKRADDLLASLSSADQKHARDLMTRLVRVARGGDEGADTRRRVLKSQLNPGAWTVAEKFADKDWRLLTIKAPLDAKESEAPAEPAVEVAHEALIRVWKTLSHWLEEDRNFLIWRQELDFDVSRWVQSKRADPTLLLNGERLHTALAQSSKNRDQLSKEELAYIRASNRRSFSRAWMQRIAVASLLLILAVSGALYWYTRTEQYQIRSILLDALSIGSGGIGGKWQSDFVTAASFLGRPFYFERRPTPRDWTERTARAVEDIVLWVQTSTPYTFSPEAIRGLALAGYKDEALGLVAGGNSSSVCGYAALASVALETGDQAVARTFTANGLEKLSNATRWHDWSQIQCLLPPATQTDPKFIAGLAAIAVRWSTKSDEFNAYLATDIAAVLETEGLHKEAQDLVRASRRDVEYRRALLIELGRKGDQTRVTDLLHSIPDPGLRRTEEVAVVNALVNDAHPERALPFVSDFHPDESGKWQRGEEWAVTRLVQVLAEPGRFEQAWSVLRQTKGIPIDPSVLLPPLLRAGRIDDALLVIASTTYRYLPEQHVPILALMLEHNRDTDADRLLKSTGDPCPTCSKAAAWLALGNYDRANELKKLKPDDQTANVNAAKALLTLGRRAQALSLVTHLGDNSDLYTRQTILREIALDDLRNGRFKEAAGLGQENRPPIPEQLWLKNVAENLAQGSTTSDHVAKCAPVVYSLIKGGYPDPANWLLATLRQTFTDWHGSSEEQRSKNLADIAAIYARVHNYREARATALLCNDASERLYAYSVILTEYARAHNPTLQRNLNGRWFPVRSNLAY